MTGAEREALRAEFTRDLTKTQRELFDAFCQGGLFISARRPGRAWLMEHFRKYQEALRGE